jgi:hypothetical protein
LCNFLFIYDEDIKKSALSVLEEACYDEVSIDFLLEAKNFQSLIKMQSDLLSHDKRDNKFDLDQNKFATTYVSKSNNQQNSSFMHSNDIDIFISKFLRSKRGFKMLKDNGWLDFKLHNWIQNGGIEYITRLEKNIYDGLNINQLNSVVQTHAMSIWIPIFEHSSDFRNEISTLKKFPF